MALIAHASTQNELRRAQMAQPEYRALSAWLVARGFAGLVPERPGHGATGGPYLEDQGGCDDANYSGAGRATAAEITSALDYLCAQRFIRPAGTVVIGHSAGALDALMASAAEFGRDARIPVTWLVAANDSYVAPGLSRQLADAFRGGGDRVDLRVVPAAGSDGHWLAEAVDGIKTVAAELDRVLSPAVKTR